VKKGFARRRGGAEKTQCYLIRPRIVAHEASRFGAAPAGAWLRLRSRGRESHRVCRTFKYDVIGAEAEIKDVTIRAVRGQFDFSEQVSEKRFIGVVNVGAGFGFAF
jgi:hypothetical protein